METRVTELKVGMSLREELRKRYPHGHPDFIDATLAELELHSKKNHDYARGGSPLGNFDRVASMLTDAGLGLSNAQVAFVYMLKQVDAVGRMLFQGYEGDVEGVVDKLRDVSIYAKLIAIMSQENNRTKILKSAFPDGFAPT